MTAKAPAKGHTAKHTATKHHKAKKHAPVKRKKPATAHAKGAAVHTAAHGAKPAKPAGFAIGDLLPVCAFEALAQSLRLAGQPVHEDDVGELWTLAGAREVTIEQALDAAVRFGLAGCTPVFGEVRGVEPPAGIGPLQVPLFTGVHIPTAALARHRPATTALTSLGIILGVDRPGYHAVLATPDGWWSWGSLYSPWDARVEEVWGVSWG